VFNAAKVNAGNSACLPGHIGQLSYSFFIRYLSALTRRHVFARPYWILTFVAAAVVGDGASISTLDLFVLTLCHLSGSRFASFFF